MYKILIYKKVWLVNRKVKKKVEIKVIVFSIMDCVWVFNVKLNSKLLYYVFIGGGDINFVF